MNPLEQAAKACFCEMETFQNPANQTAIIAKHMEAFARERNAELLKDKERLAEAYEVLNEVRFKHASEIVTLREALEKAALAKGDV